MVRIRAPRGRGMEAGATEFRQWKWKLGKAMANFSLMSECESSFIQRLIVIWVMFVQTIGLWIKWLIVRWPSKVRSLKIQFEPSVSLENGPKLLVIKGSNSKDESLNLQALWKMACKSPNLKADKPNHN